MKNWSPFTFILLGALVLLAFGNFIPGTYDPLRPQDSPVKDIKEQARSGTYTSGNTGARNTEGDPRLSAAREQHILYGDDSGGGHHHSANRPCKTEFPDNWTAEKIIETVKKLAANDNADWRLEDNGYYVAEQPYEGLDVRIVLDQEGDDIITSYPTNLPRNECDRY